MMNIQLFERLMIFNWFDIAPGTVISSAVFCRAQVDAAEHVPAGIPVDRCYYNFVPPYPYFKLTGYIFKIEYMGTLFILLKH